MADTTKPQRRMFADALTYRAALDAWRAAQGPNRSSGDPSYGQPIQTGDLPGNQANMSRMQGGQPPYQMTQSQPARGQATAPAARQPNQDQKASQPAAAGLPGADQPSAASGGRPWWEAATDDSTPDGGTGWNGTSNIRSDHPDWWGEIQHFGRQHQHALENAYNAGDEAAFQQIRDQARKDLYQDKAPGYAWADAASNPAKSYRDVNVPDAWKQEIGGWDTQSQNDWLRAFEAGDTASGQAIRDDARKKQKY